MKLNYYQFQTTELQACRMLVKGLLNLAGPHAVGQCTGMPSAGTLYVNLSSPLPIATIRAVIIAIAVTGLPGAEQMAITLRCTRRATRSASQPASGHSRFNPNLLELPE